MTMKLKYGVLIVVLLVANVRMATLTHGSPVSLRQQFSEFPKVLGGWTGQDSAGLSEGERQVLRADDYLWRVYSRNGQRMALFVAYYQSQRSGDTLHSPKNCLPGAGWEPTKQEIVRFRGASGSAIEANHMIVAKGSEQQDVLYWYQANSRRFASEYRGKVYLVYDAVTKGRTDGALVRITSFSPNRTPMDVGILEEFAREVGAVLPQFLPD